MAPSHVQHKKDGPWYPWTSGHIDSDQLRAAQVNKQATYLNGCLTFGLKSVDGQEWTVESGWKRSSPKT